MIYKIAFLCYLGAVGINQLQAIADREELLGLTPKKEEFVCTPTDIKDMIRDGLADDTISAICFEK